MKPSHQEVEDYALSIGFKLKGSYFCDFYASKDWCVGKAPMKDWKAAVRVWKHNAPDGSLVGAKYDHGKMEARKAELEQLKEREWRRRQGGKLELL